MRRTLSVVVLLVVLALIIGAEPERWVKYTKLVLRPNEWVLFNNLYSNDAVVLNLQGSWLSVYPDWTGVKIDTETCRDKPCQVAYGLSALTVGQQGQDLRLVVMFEPASWPFASPVNRYNLSEGGMFFLSQGRDNITIEAKTDRQGTSVWVAQPHGVAMIPLRDKRIRALSTFAEMFVGYIGQDVYAMAPFSWTPRNQYPLALNGKWTVLQGGGEEVSLAVAEFGSWSRVYFKRGNIDTYTILSPEDWLSQQDGYVIADGVKLFPKQEGRRDIQLEFGSSNYGWTADQQPMSAIIDDERIPAEVATDSLSLNGYHTLVILEDGAFGPYAPERKKEHPGFGEPVIEFYSSPDKAEDLAISSDFGPWRGLTRETCLEFECAIRSEGMEAYTEIKGGKVRWFLSVSPRIPWRVFQWRE